MEHEKINKSMKTRFKFNSLHPVVVEDWIVKCSFCNGNIMIVMIHTMTEELLIKYFRNERDANRFVNTICSERE